MKILVTGASGLLGAHLLARLSSGAHQVIGTDRHPGWADLPVKQFIGDLREPAFIGQLIQRMSPEVLIHCAAMVNLEACEQDPQQAYATHEGVTAQLAHHLPDSSLFVYISTDGVMSGDRPLSDETTSPTPRTVYGRSKLHGEWEAQLKAKRHLIVRTNFYGWSSGRKQTSAEWMVQALEKQEPMTAYEDCFFTPIYVVDLVERLERLIDTGHEGLFHLGGAERVSKLEFVQALAAEAGLSTQGVVPGKLESDNAHVPRPKDISLDSGKFTRTTGLPVPDLREGISRFLKDRSVPIHLRGQVQQTASSVPQGVQ